MKMIKSFLIIILSLTYFMSNGQGKRLSLSAINSISQAENLIKTHPKIEGKIFEIKTNSDTIKTLEPIYDEKIGFTLLKGEYTYKILNIDSFISFRVSYIYLNGEKLSKKEIDSLNREIIAKFNNGISFIDLAKQYNMDGNTTGDTNWFVEGMMVPKFEAAVKKHKRGEIFAIESLSPNWYHVVLKTFDDIYFKKITVIKVKSSS